MFDIGLSELLLVGVVALVVLGPERLPKAARTAGLYIGRARAMLTRYTGELERELRAEELRQTLREEARRLESSVQDLHLTATTALTPEEPKPLSPPAATPVTAPDGQGTARETGPGTSPHDP